MIKLFRSGWLDIAVVRFLRVYRPRLHMNINNNAVTQCHVDGSQRSLGYLFFYVLRNVNRICFYVKRDCSLFSEAVL